MKRLALENLKKWSKSKSRKPLILQGARQVGKTWLMKTFGEECYDDVVYLNFDEDSSLKHIFDDNFDIARIVLLLEIKAEKKIVADKTLIIFDEIQEAPRAVTALKYFCENAPEYHVIAAGSLLGVASLEGTGFPVGKVDTLSLYPMTFREFLIANGKESFISLLDNQDWQSIRIFKTSFIEQLKYYYFVGGMPEAVDLFVREKDLVSVRGVQTRLLDSYRNDFAKHAPTNIVPRIRLIWDSVASQLAKENKKFTYSDIKKGGRASEFELALQWLKDAGLVNIVNRITKPHVPLSGYQNKAFKLYFIDVGLLCAQSGLDARSLLEGNTILTEFKGALTEQYVLQELIAANGLKPYYWSSENSQGEIDFVFQHNTKIYPLEVKAEENLKAKSLLAYARKNKVTYSIRTSMSDYRADDISENGVVKDGSQFLINIPLYGVSAIVTEIGGLSQLG